MDKGGIRIAAASPPECPVETSAPTPMKSEERINTIIMFVSSRKPDKIIEEELERRGLKSRWAKSLKMAVHLLDSTPETAGVVTDLALPDGNWRDVVQRVRQVSRSVPIVLVTAASTAELWWDALDCDVTDIQLTPLTASGLCEALGANGGNGDDA